MWYNSFSGFYKKAKLNLGLIIIPLIIQGCTTVNPATGQRDFTPFMSPQKELSIGKQQHPGILQQNGGVMKDERVTKYIDDLGQRLASHSELKDYPFTFTVLDTPLVNAFALPGGYVYVTRGIMSIVNNESELASVIGHEIGHVTARHSAKRYNNQMFAGIGGILVGVLSGDGGLANSFNQGAQVYLMSYSRNQEYQSDDLGIRYSSRAGFDPHAAAGMLQALGNEHKLQLILAGRSGEEPKSDFNSTHPNTQDRVNRARSVASQTNIPLNSRNQNQEVYFNIIDGMRWGDDPNQGVIQGKTFIHPTMKLKFTVPQEYTLANTSEAVLAKGSGAAKGSMVMFSGGKMNNQTLSNHAAEIWKAYKIEGQMQNPQNITVNGMKAITGYASTQIQNQSYVVRMVAIEYSQNLAYHFMMLTPSANTQNLSAGLQKLTYSFNKISDQEASKIKGRHIKIVRARNGDTIEKVASQMAFDNHKVDRFLALNGLTKGQQLKNGQLLKIIVMDK